MKTGRKLLLILSLLLTTTSTGPDSFVLKVPRILSLY